MAKWKMKLATLQLKNYFDWIPKMYSFLVDNCEHKKVKGLNKNAVVTISHDQCKAVLLMNV